MRPCGRVSITNEEKAFERMQRAAGDSFKRLAMRATKDLNKRVSWFILNNLSKMLMSLHDHRVKYVKVVIDVVDITFFSN
jgi:hypothetical protein